MFVMGDAFVSGVAILGGFGQLGSELAALLGDRGVPLGRAEADVTNPLQLAAALDAVRPRTVINCVAYNLVDRAEDFPDEAFALNGTAVRNVARWCDDHQTPLLHVSTDYVFGRDANRRIPYTEDDLCGPLGVYGQSKALGESVVREHCPQSWVVRTCGLYGRKATRVKGNFVETMLRLGRERPELRLIDDQRCTPTSAADLAEALVKLIDTDAYGLYHATNANDCSWREFAEQIFRLAGLGPNVIPITSAEYGAKAPRPAYSVLNCGKLEGVLNHGMRPWQEALAEYVSAR